MSMLSGERVARNPQAVVSDPVRMRVFGGQAVTLDELLAYLDRAGEGDRARIAALPADSPVLRSVLQGPLAQSWVLAKDALAYAKTGLRNDLMRKLLEYRAWHHDHILVRTKQRVQELTGDDSLKWGAEGSASLTSDIDVNLKGNQTETAVRVFNQLFRADGWAREAGVVYDVNVYAKDFMFSPKGFDAAGASGPVTLVKKEGGRAGAEQGGAATPEMYSEDQKQQQSWALVKARLHMSEAQWKKYVDDTDVPVDVQRLALSRYATYMAELQARMQLDGKGAAPAMGDGTLEGPGTGRIEATAAGILGPGSSELGVESLKMESSNRVYERKLDVIKEQRRRLEAAIAAVNGAPGDLERAADVDASIVRLRTVVSEAALWSNEAYVTDAAVNHAVVGLQIGATISQTIDDLMVAVTENMADAIKESRRHSSHAWEAAAKSGKYVWRMTDAAKNAGLGDTPGLERLYRAAFELAPVIKSGSSPATVDGRAALVPQAGADDKEKVEGVLRGLGVLRSAPDVTRGGGTVDDEATVDGWQELIVKTATDVQRAAKRYDAVERGYAAIPVTAQESRATGVPGKTTRHARYNTN
ncbi:MAG TPA: hypothetical protein VFP61_04900 [Acidimicrobiales bacterium]|nr:hypothetical protein [Acidimicrobiales bacterium]